MKKALFILAIAFLALDQGDCQKRRTRKEKIICPTKCQCSEEILKQDLSIRGIQVNCSGRNLKRFPSPLPASTTTLLLDGNRISTLRSEYFSNVKNLRTLNLERNRLQKLQFGSFGLLPSLTTLYLQKNRINETKFGFLRNTPAVRVLNLANNKISSLHYAMFDIVDHLQVLDLSNNNISSIEDGSFLGLKRLQTLLLNNNKIKRVTAQLLPDVYSLKYLNLNRNQIAMIEPNAFERQNVLEILSMIDNQITKLSYRILNGLKALKNLYLQRNQIKEIDPWSLTRLKSLETLYLYSNLLTKIEANIFVGLGKLKVLHLGVNNIRYIAEDAFIDLRVLTTLYLDSNKLTTLSGRIFSGLRQVRDLQLYFNNISFVAKDAFAELIKLNRLVWDIPDYFRQRQEYATAVGNNLHCDCNALWLRNWLKRTGKSRITCQSPPALKGVPLVTVKDSNTACEPVKVTVSPKKVLVLFREDATLHCTAQPGASYTWILNGSVVKLDDLHTINPLGTLVVKAVSKKDVGQYVCIATNAAGSSADTAELYIGERPIFTVLPEAIDVKEPVRPAIFKCSAKGVPKPTITWYKDGLQIRVASEDSSGFHIDSDGALTFLGKRHHITEEGHLIILNPLVEDEGPYTCVAQNEVGKISHRVTLYTDMSAKCSYECSTGAVCQPTKYDCVCTQGFHKEGMNCAKDKKPTPKPVPTKSVTGSGSGMGSGTGSGTESGDGSGVAGESSGGGSGSKVDGSASGSGVSSGTGKESKPPIDQEESGDEVPTRPSHKTKRKKTYTNAPSTGNNLLKKKTKIIDIDQDNSASGSAEQTKVDSGNQSGSGSESGSGSGETLDGIVEVLIPKRRKPGPTPVIGFARSGIRPLNPPPT